MLETRQEGHIKGEGSPRHATSGPGRAEHGAAPGKALGSKARQVASPLPFPLRAVPAGAMAARGLTMHEVEEAGPLLEVDAASAPARRPMRRAIAGVAGLSACAAVIVALARGGPAARATTAAELRPAQKAMQWGARFLGGGGRSGEVPQRVDQGHGAR